VTSLVVHKLQITTVFGADQSYRREVVCCRNPYLYAIGFYARVREGDPEEMLGAVLHAALKMLDAGAVIRYVTIYM
jgi:hypothetical protein